jgi:hypothetical protein
MLGDSMPVLVRRLWCYVEVYRLPLPLSESIAGILAAFALAFTRPTFEHVQQILVTGTLLTSGRRTVTAALRAVGLGGERHFTT